MASMREIKRRRESIQSTEQITKAMRLVATAKLKRAQARAEGARPYSDLMYETMRAAAFSVAGGACQYCRESDSTGRAVVAVTSNRGLAGGYNHNIVRMVTGHRELMPSRTGICAVGRKGRDAFSRNGYRILKDYSEEANGQESAMAWEIAQWALNLFETGDAGAVYLAYTSFQNTVTHIPTLIRLLPLPEFSGNAERPDLPMNYEPDEETVLDFLVPKYLGSLIHGALLEAAASEHGARMAAMDAAANNAGEMIEELTLQYNRARQGAITQELTEIIAGAGAVGG